MRYRGVRALFFPCFLVVFSLLFVGCPQSSTTFTLKDYFPLAKDATWEFVIVLTNSSMCPECGEQELPFEIDGDEPFTVVKNKVTENLYYQRWRVTKELVANMSGEDPDASFYKGVRAWKVEREVIEYYKPNPEDESYAVRTIGDLAPWYFVVLGERHDLSESDLARYEDAILYQMSEEDYENITNERMQFFDSMHHPPQNAIFQPPDDPNDLEPIEFVRWERYRDSLSSNGNGAYERMTKLWWRFVPGTTEELFTPRGEAGALPWELSIDVWRDITLGGADGLFTMLRSQGVPISPKDPGILETLSNKLFKQNEADTYGIRSDFSPYGQLRWEAWNLFRENWGPLLIQGDLTEAIDTIIAHYETEDKATLIPDCCKFEGFLANAGYTSAIRPKADFTYTGMPEAQSGWLVPSERRAPRTVSFSDTSVDTIGTLYAWQWDFGFGREDWCYEDCQTPQYVYISAGLYAPSLEIRATNGDDTVNRADDAFEVGDFVKGDYVEVRRTPENDIVDYRSYEGDGSDIVRGYIEATELPTANFSWDGRATALSRLSPSVTFNDDSTPNNDNWPDGIERGTRHPITSRQWDFVHASEPRTSGASFTHEFPGPGHYDVTLDVTSEVGTSEPFTQCVEVTEQPEAAFTWVDRLTPADRLTRVVQFQDESDPRNENACSTYQIKSRVWNFGDPQSLSNTATGLNPTHEFSGPGCYLVSLTVTCGPVDQPGDQTLTDTITQEVEVTELPVVSFSTPNRETAEDRLVKEVAFVGTADVRNEAACQTYQLDNPVWAWNFGDPDSGGNNISNVQNPTHIFSKAGCFLVRVTLSTDTWPDVTYEEQVEVLDAPTVSFSFADRETPADRVDTAVSFAGLANLDNVASCTPLEVKSWQWNFGDLESGALNTSSAQNPTHDFSGAGCFTVAVSITAGPVGQSDATLTASFSQQVEVTELPTAQFTWVDRETPVDRLVKTVVFQNLSQANNVYTCEEYPITQYSWDFGDGESSADENPEPHTYENPGCYPVKLSVTSAIGTVEVSRDVEVTALPDADFTADVLSGPAPLEVNFTDQSLAPAFCAEYPISDWQWDFGDEETGTGATPQHVYQEPGIYEVTLTVTNAVGSDTETKTEYIEVTGIETR